MTGIPINPPNAPLILPDGRCDPAWYKFFLAIQRQIGGPSDPFDDSALLAALPGQSDEKINTAALSSAQLIPPTLPPVEPPEGLVPPQASREPFEDRLEPYGAQREAALAHSTSGAALTKADDTNVTLALGGSPSTALLQAASLTLGWTGQLSVARGGSGAGTLTGLLLGNGTSAFTAVAPGTGVTTALAVNVGSAGAFVTFNGALGTPSSGTLTNCTFPTLNQNTTGSAATLTTTRTIWGQNFNGSANVTGDLALGTASLTLTGSIGATGARAAKVWATDAEFTNAPTLGGAAATGTGGLVRSANPSITGELGINCASVGTVILRLEQSGASDAGLEFNRESATEFAFLSYNRTGGAYTDMAFKGPNGQAFRIDRTTGRPTCSLPLMTVAPSTSAAGLNLPHGTAPSSPVNGDIWTTTAGLFVRINGATVGPLS